MKKSLRLTPILDLADKKEQDAARAFALQQQKVQTIIQGRERLQGFLDSYHARYQNTGAMGLTVSQLAEYRAFLGKIHSAIEEQAASLSQAEEELLSKRRIWEAARRHREGMTKLIQKARQEEIKLEDKREQADMDERAARKALRGASFSE